MKVFFKAIVVLALLFVMLYVGMNNTHDISFQFPIAGTTAKSPIHAPAAILFFAMFAIGVLAGTMLTAGGGGGKKSAPAKDKK